MDYHFQYVRIFLRKIFVNFNFNIFSNFDTRNALLSNN